MHTDKLIGVRYLRVGGKSVPVLLSRNDGSTVAGQCLLGGSERPIIDGPSAKEVLSAIEDVLEGLLLARERRLA
jgi:hypothetical protein